MKLRIGLLLPVVFVAFSCLAVDRAAAQKLQAVVSQSQQTGKPIMAICTSKTCPPCKALLKRFETDVELQQLAMQHFVPINLDVSTPDFQTWVQKVGAAGQGVPMIYFVSPTGEVLHKQSGAPQGAALNRLLLMVAAQAGPANPQQGEGPDKELIAAVRNANMLLNRDRTGQAITVLAPHLEKVEQAAKSDHPAERLLVQIVQRLQGDSEKSLADAKQKLEAEGQQFFGLLALLQTKRLYGGLPEVAASLEKELTAFRDDAEKAPWIAQAEMIDGGRAKENEGQRSAAVAVYRDYLKQHPDTLGAKLCSTRIDQLASNRSSAKDTQKPTTTVSKPPMSPLQLTKAAASNLKMAKMYADSRPDKARVYAQKVIDAIPESAEAREARRLLQRL